MTRGQAQRALAVFTWPEATPVQDDYIIASAHAELADWDTEVEAICARLGFPKQVTA